MLGLGERIGFDFGGFIEEFLGDDVLCDEEEGAAESGDEAKEIAGNLGGAGEDDAEGEGDEGKVD